MGSTMSKNINIFAWPLRLKAVRKLQTRQAVYPPTHPPTEKQQQKTAHTDILIMSKPSGQDKTFQGNSHARILKCEGLEGTSQTMCTLFGKLSVTGNT